MEKCSDCQGKMRVKQGVTPDGVPYQYYKCLKCGEEILHRQQLHKVAEQYRELKRYYAKLSKWGVSLGVRIPKALVEQYHLHPDGELAIIPEKDGFRLIPVKK